MAMKSMNIETGQESANSGDLHTIEECESEEDEHGGKRARGLSPCFPTDLVVPATSRHFGSVAVTDSESVHFGDKYIKIYNGPVNIRQIVQPSSGINNPSYIKTEHEDIPNKYNSGVLASIPTVKVQLWMKMTISAVVVILISVICAIVLLTQSRNNQDGKVLSENVFIVNNTHSTSTVHKMVVEICNGNIQLLVAAFIILTFILLITMAYSLLRNEVSVLNDAQNVKKKSSNNNSIREEKICNGDELLISPHHLRIVSRTDWLAQPAAGELDKIKQPVPWVIITHTATQSCHNQSSCVLAVRLIQTFHIESKGWFDIGYNFLVGGDGSAYEGRGWDYVGAHTKGYNKYSIAIAFIGTFNKDDPSRQQVDACKKIIKRGLEEGKLAKDYKLFVHRQLMSTLSPGDKVFNIVKEWPHFVKTYTDDLIPNY